MHRLRFFECQKIFRFRRKPHTYQNITTKIAHAGVFYFIKKTSIEMHIPGKDGDWKTMHRSPCLFIVHSTHTVGVKSMSPVDIKLLFGNLHNITALHHNTNIFSIQIK